MLTIRPSQIPRRRKILLITLITKIERQPTRALLQPGSSIHHIHAKTSEPLVNFSFETAPWHSRGRPLLQFRGATGLNLFLRLREVLRLEEVGLVFE